MLLYTFLDLVVFFFHFTLSWLGLHPFPTVSNYSYHLKMVICGLFSSLCFVIAYMLVFVKHKYLNTHHITENIFVLSYFLRYNLDCNFFKDLFISYM